MITVAEQMSLYETSLTPGWDIVLREVMDIVNKTGMEVIASTRPGATIDDCMFRSGQHAGVRDIFEYLKRVEKDAAAAIRGRSETQSRPEPA